MKYNYLCYMTDPSRQTAATSHKQKLFLPLWQHTETTRRTRNGELGHLANPNLVQTLCQTLCQPRANSVPCFFETCPVVNKTFRQCCGSAISGMQRHGVVGPKTESTQVCHSTRILYKLCEAIVPLHDPSKV